jgi:uncharacterized membrane protein HdeD (DUF308 family)
MKLIGLIMVIVGFIAFAVPSFTFFTRERVADAGFFTIDAQRPHTIIMNPGLGILLIVVGVIMMVLGQRERSAI